MKLLYKPLGIVLGLLAGAISRRLFDRIWALIDRQEPPKATTRETTWSKVLAAAAVEGVTFKVTRPVRTSYSGLAGLPEDQRRRVFAEVAEILDADPSLHEGDRLRLPFVVEAYRATRADPLLDTRPSK